MNQIRALTSSWADPAGICLSSLCALHCLAGPLLVTALPLAGFGFLVDERTELLFLLASLTLAAGSLAWGFHLHRQQRALLTLGAAAAMIAAGRIFLEGAYEITLVVVGAGLLTISHVINFQLCRACRFCEHKDSMEHSQIIFRASDVSLGYGERTILRGINLEVHQGEFWFFLGQNGGGKTTLMKAVLGLIAPQSGTLWLHPVSASREQIGFVPQRCELNPTLPTTVKEFVLLGLVGISVDRREREIRLTWALEKMGLSGQEERNYWSLSGGQRQRALVARALVRRPTLLVLDEPTNNLDLPTEDALLQLLVALNKEEQLTLLFVTHNVGIAARYATHVALLHAGNLLAGPRSNLLTATNLAHIYGIDAAPHLALVSSTAPFAQPQGDLT